MCDLYKPSKPKLQETKQLIWYDRSFSKNGRLPNEIIFQLYVNRIKGKPRDQWLKQFLNDDNSIDTESVIIP